MKPILLIAALALCACDSRTSGESNTDSSGISSSSAIGKEANITISDIYWSDGDSGKIDGESFRLKDIDAPETGGVGAAVGGAECELERERGYKAKEFALLLTEGATIVVTQDYGLDRYGRLVVDLSADGIDVGGLGIGAGYFKPWPHDENGFSLSTKPEWCFPVSTTTPVPTTTTTTTTTPIEPFVDKDCGDFKKQSEAQIFFKREGGPASDPHGLDGDGNGIACESLP